MMLQWMRIKGKKILIGLALVLILAFFSVQIFRSFQEFSNTNQQKDQGAFIVGNEDTYAKAIQESYTYLVNRYVIPVSPKLLFLSAQDTIEIFEKHWLNEENDLNAEGKKTLLRWERNARSPIDTQKAESIRAPQKEKPNKEQAEQFAAEFEQYSPEDLKQAYQKFLANAKLQGFDNKALAKNLYKEIMAALCRPLHDPFSGFYQNSEFYQLRDTTNGSFGGVGLYITKKAFLDLVEDEEADSTANNTESHDYLDLQRHYVKVSRPFHGGPSFRAGIMADDFIYAINGQSANDWSVEKVQDEVRGKPGSKVQITVLRARKHKIDFEVVREKIEVPAVASDMIRTTSPSGKPISILYVSLSQFHAGAGKQFDEQVQNLLHQNKAAGINAMILDMRNNPGGLLNVAVDIADQFLTKGLIVSTDARTSDDVRKFNAKEKISIPEDLPVFVMVNEISASAAEIVAGALQDDLRAEVIGQKSYGKGSVQVPLTNLPEGILKVTIAHYYTPKGINLANNGIQPDHQFAGPKLSDEDQEALVELFRTDTVGSFVNQNPYYTNDTLLQFYNKKIKNSYNISLNTIKKLAYREKMRFMEELPAYSLDYDNILQQAVDYISEKL